MPASLWLLPPPGVLHTTFQTLISKTLPPRIPGPVPDFQPHITISSGIPLTSASEFQKALDSINLDSSSSPPYIRFKRLRYGTALWTKITIEIHLSPSLVSLAVACRSALVPGCTEEDAKEWVQVYSTPAESGIQGFIPHLSLVYYGEDLDRTVMEAVRGDVSECGLVTEEIQLKGKSMKEMGGWVGGKLVIVDTTKPVEEWKDSILAERELEL
ncbi:hypothetical protein TWF718_000073 [Orbilia javanica]|uniref:2',3'-cyclic-nucleotide 3'-phosphodiesterase n=1 Tax=Orbilia javanica TaxID=47235 RepID=A0AAN8RG64_9PEZI